MADVTQDDWYKRLKAQAANRDIADDVSEQSSFNFSIKRKYTRQKPVYQRATRENIHASQSIIEMHNESMARLRKRFMPPLNRD